ncbi:uncharacterized protein LOC131949932 [Physella acuta]|uniref:uncharacterized protein LOC131949932 n=1 Tax=Physella acuta TaxID=109671 RepID=UPI0027DD1658|nr:uncharacterized protein LOC131949932 [Physella acuta]
MWNKGKPNNEFGNEHCLEMFRDGTLNDNDCAQPLSFICMEVHETTTNIETDTTMYPTSRTTTATLSFTTEGNVSNTGNVSKDTLECISKTATAFDNNCYELFTTPKNWTEAKKYCSNFNGKRMLAKVSSPSVLRYFNSFRPFYTRVWLGGNDQLQEGEWVWTDGTKANLTSMWGYTEPNNTNGNEDCLEIFNDGTLNDDDCAQSFSFICMEIHATNAAPETNLTTYPTATATPSITTERNESKLNNDFGNSSEEINSLDEWIVILIVTVVVAFFVSVFVVVVVVKLRSKTRSPTRNLIESGNTHGIVNQTRANAAYDNVTRTEDGGFNLVKFTKSAHAYANVVINQEQNAVQDNDNEEGLYTEILD